MKLKRTLGALCVAAFLLAGVGAFLFATNPTPSVAPISAEEAGRPGKPYVVKLHARWCPVCMLTKGVWAQVQETYAGRVHLLVLDFTNAETTARSRAEAQRLGLAAFFEEYAWATGRIVILDGQLKAVKADIKGDRNFETYRTAIDAALRGAAK